jgi:hypothetical protein
MYVDGVALSEMNDLWRRPESDIRTKGGCLSATCFDGSGGSNT